MSAWLAYADNDLLYAEWLERVDALCERFIDVSLRDLMDSGDLDPREAFFVFHARPEQFFNDVLLPFVVYEHGAEFIYEHIADNVMWGTTRPQEREW